MAAAKKMDELLVTWLSNDATYEGILEMVHTYQVVAAAAAREEEEEQLLQENESSATNKNNTSTFESLQLLHQSGKESTACDDADSSSSPRGVVVIPPFYPISPARKLRRKNQDSSDSSLLLLQESWEGSLPVLGEENVARGGHDNELKTNTELGSSIQPDDASQDQAAATTVCVRDKAWALFQELGLDLPAGEEAAAADVTSSNDLDKSDSRFRVKHLPLEHFSRITKDICHFPSFFNAPLYQRILDLWNAKQQQQDKGDPNQPQIMTVVTFEMLEYFYKTELEPFDMVDRFFRLVKQPEHNYIQRNDFLPFIKALLSDHPGLEFLSNHAEFQEKYAVTVITRIFYCVNTCHSGKITSRQVRRSDLLQAFQQVDDEEDINKVTRYLSYEHFYVLYCRFWELDQDRDYRIGKDDLLKYCDHSLSHMIVDRIFDAAPRPFEPDPVSSAAASDNHRDYMTYESFIYFM
jgi:hypothetical protein